jgi:predicted PurR-regulated permease PerM
LLAGFFALVVPVVIDQARTLWAVRETIVEQLERLGRGIFDEYQKLPLEVRLQVESSLDRLGDLIGKALQQAAQGTVVAISYTISLVLGIAIIPFWTFYLLNDSHELGQAALNMVPLQLREDLLSVLKLMDTVFGAYLRGQLLLGVIIGVLSAIGLSIIGINFALVLGVVAGICELIPNIGPILGAIPALVVAMAQDPTKALITAIFAIAIQQLENLFLTPRVLGKSVQLHPVLVMVVLVIGSELGGVVGLFLAPLATAVLRDLFRYFYYRFADEPLSPVEALSRVHRREKLSLEV